MPSIYMCKVARVQRSGGSTSLLWATACCALLIIVREAGPSRSALSRSNNRWRRAMADYASCASLSVATNHSLKFSHAIFLEWHRSSIWCMAARHYAGPGGGVEAQMRSRTYSACFNSHWACWSMGWCRAFIHSCVASSNNWAPCASCSWIMCVALVTTEIYWACSSGVMTYCLHLYWSRWCTSCNTLEDNLCSSIVDSCANSTWMSLGLGSEVWIVTVWGSKHMFLLAGRAWKWRRCRSRSWHCNVPFKLGSQLIIPGGNAHALLLPHSACPCPLISSSCELGSITERRVL